MLSFYIKLVNLEMIIGIGESNLSLIKKDIKQVKKNISQYDYLLRELSTPKMRFYKNKIPKHVKDLSYFKNMSYEEFCSRG